MASLILVPWGETTWSAAGRLGGRSSGTLSEAGLAAVAIWAERISARSVTLVFSSEEQTSVEVAKAIAAKADVPRKTIADLAEVDVGLWDGLTTEELTKRYAKTFKQWRADRSSVQPPQGEDGETVMARLSAALKRITKKYPERTAVVVLGPLAFTFARGWVESVEPAEAAALAVAHPVRYESLGDGAKADMMGFGDDPAAGADSARGAHTEPSPIGSTEHRA